MGSIMGHDGGWRRRSWRYLFESRWLKLRQDEITLPSGAEITYTVIEHPGFVVIVPMLVDGRVVMEQVYRHPLQRTVLECPSGGLDGEAPATAARRELEEETGYRAKKFSVFLDLFPTPGFLEERMYLLLAEGLSAGEAQPEEDEKILVAAYTREQLERMIQTRKLRDAKSIAGLLIYHGRR